jgi:DNA-binding NarL/FixJ family response regulator
MRLHSVNQDLLQSRRQSRLSIVDDDASLHQLIMDLGGLGHFEVSHACLDAARALKCLPDSPPDMVLMDVRLPGMSGIDCAEKLKIIMPDVPILILTAYPDESDFFRALIVGANGYLVKPFTTDVLLEAIKETLEGGFVLGKAVAPYLVHFFRHCRILAAENALSRREQQMLACIFQGCTDKEIASKLRIGTATVHTHLHRLFHKLQSHSRRDIISKFLDSIPGQSPPGSDD